MKKFYKFVFILIIIIDANLTAFTQIPNYVPLDSLKAWYPFNGNANDESGNGNNGILQGEIANPVLTTDRFGNINSAYEFGGYFNKNWIKVPNSSSLQFGCRLSVSLWFKQCSFDGMNGYGNYVSNGYHILMSKAGDGIAAVPGIWSGIYTDINNLLHISFCNKNGYGNTINFAEDTTMNCFDLCEWIHFVCVIDSNVMKMYFNGTLKKQKIITAAFFTAANLQDMYFGRMYGSSVIWYPYKGDIDDVCIYNKALSQANVSSLFNNYFNPLGYNNALVFDSIIISNHNCLVSNSGSIIIYANSINAPYQYSIDGGINYQSSNVFSGLINGSYNVKIKNSCNEKDTLILLGLSTVNKNISICQGDSYLLPGGLSVFLGGIYIDTLKTVSNCDSLIIKTNLIVNPNPTVNLGNDTTLYQESTLTLNAGNAGSTYLWSTNDTTQTINVSTSGTYWVKVTNSGGCFSSDSIYIRFISPCNLLCNNDFEDIQHTSPGTVILLPQSQIPCWRTTAIDEKIEIWSNGAYGVNSYSGNQFIELNANYVSTLYQNFYANAGTNINIGFAHRGRQGVDSMSVSIGPTGGPYTNLGIYGDGASWNYYNLNYSISNTGNYSLRFNSIYAIGGQTYGNFLDDIQIILTPIPIVNLGNDTTLTQGSTLTLNAGNTGSTYLWSTNDTTQTINLSTSGTYWVKVTNSGGCYSSDTIHVDFTTSTNTNPMNDTTICKGETVTLTANVAATNTWQYFQDFENTVGSEWSDTNHFIYNGSKNLGFYGNQTINLNLNSLPAHDSIEVSFDLYIHDSWDGNPPNGPDFWNLFINNYTIINTTFSNNPGTYSQSYPQNYLFNNPIQTGANAVNLPSRCLYSGTSLYKINRKITSNSSALQISFDGKPNQGICDESWSIDNVKVKLLNTPLILPTYLWSTGATTASITVSPNQTTNYTVTVTNGSTTFADSATVNVLNPQINNGQDTTICKGETVVLKNYNIQNNFSVNSQLLQSLQQNLIAYYPFNGNANDESGNANNGTVNGATLTTDRFGNANSAYNFNGSSASIALPNTLMSSMPAGCFSAWFKLNSIPTAGNSYVLFDKTLTFTINDFQLVINENAKLRLMMNDIYNTGNSIIFSNVTFSTNLWYNIIVSWAGNTAKIYVNNLLDTTLTNTNGFLPASNHMVNIGVGDIGTGHFDGTIDDVMIFDSSLSSSQVNQIYNNTQASYLWSTNDTTQSITVTPNQTTTYTLSVTNGNISCMDTITVNVLNPQINNGQDTTICKGESVVLTAQTSSQNACFKSQLPTNLQQGLVAFYPFCGNANDESGNANNGTVNGATLTTDRFGNANSAYIFNGVSNYISVPNSLGLSSLISQATISGWVFSTNGGGHMICKSNNSILGDFRIQNGLSGSSFIIDGKGFTFNYNFIINQWSHIAITFLNGTAKLYVNGNLIGSTSNVSSTFSINRSTNMEIGRDPWGAIEYHYGKLDDYFIYNRALSATEIQQLYTLGTATSASYLWSTNDTTQSITVTPTQTTTYTLSLTNGNISCIDTITVNVLNPQINNSLDTTICKGETICLNVTTANVINHVDSIANFIYIGKLNNHLYYRSNYQTDWQSAKIACQAKGGHLATISSIQENNLLFNYCNSYSQQTWFGFTDEVFEGDWKWITGEPVCYTNWAPGEPNNSFGGEDYGTLWCSINSWNDGDYIAPFYFLLEIEKNHYLWSTNDTTQSISVSPTQTTSYSVLVINGNTSCSDTIKVFVSNPQINLGNDTTICQGQSKTLAVGSGYSSYLWSTGATNQQITVQNTGTYLVKAISNQGCTVSDTINLTFLPVQSNIIRDTILCLGQSVIFNPGAGYTNHLWSTGATTASLNVNLPGTFWLQVKQPNGCVIKDTAIVKFDSLNIVVASFTNPTCYGGNNGSINTTTTGLYPGFTYSWNTTPVITTANISNRTAGNYTVTVTDAKGCTKSVSKTLTAPNPVAVSLGNDTSICQGQSLTLQATQIFTSYLWSTGATTQSINVNAQGTYWLKGTNSSGCNGYDTINITVNPTPVIQIAPGNPSICKGDSVTLVATSNITGTTFNWNNGGNGSSITVSPPATANYTVIGSKNTCKDTATVNVTVNPVPVVTISPANPSVCKGEAVTLTASSNLANTTFLWNNSSANTTINVSPNTNTNYFVVGSLSTCKDTAFVTVTTKPLPVLNVTADKNPICEGETVKLTANSDIASTTYLWSNTSTAGFINVSPLSSSYYFVTGTASNCHDTAGINIDVISKQSIDLGDDRYLCAGDEVNLTATNLTGSYLWSNGNNSNSVTLTEPGVYWLRVDNNGCIASDTIEMKKCSEIWVPNVFTPNGDGTNEIFKPVTTEIQKLTMYIYNRWGEMIFETSDINGGWDGKLHGNEVPSGVYFWVIRYNENRSSALNIEKEIKGSVTLLR